jgi:hypothetical protein
MQFARFTWRVPPSAGDLQRAARTQPPFFLVWNPAASSAFLRMVGLGKGRRPFNALCASPRKPPRAQTLGAGLSHSATFKLIH